ncbi:hypothetical protein [Anaeromyxobacter oryzae]
MRRLAKFLLHAAEELEVHGDRFGHEHFESFDRSQPRKPRFVVAAPSSEK